MKTYASNHQIKKCNCLALNIKLNLALPLSQGVHESSTSKTKDNAMFYNEEIEESY